MEKEMEMENIEVMASFDKKVKDYISLNEQLKEMKKEIETEKAQLEKLYRKPNDIEERLEGIETFMEKVTIRKEKTYDLKGLRVLLKALGINKDDVISRKWEFVVDEAALKSLVKKDVIPQEAIDKLISYGTTTFRSKFGIK